MKYLIHRMANWGSGCVFANSNTHSDALAFFESITSRVSKWNRLFIAYTFVVKRNQKVLQCKGLKHTQCTEEGGIPD